MSVSKIFLIYICLTWLVTNAWAAEATVEQLQQLDARIEALQAQMHDTRSEYGRLQRLLQSREEEMGTAAERLETLNEELTDAKRALTDLQDKQTVQFKQLQMQRQILAQQIRAAYSVGRQDYLKLLLNQQDPFAIGRVLTYYQYINRARVQQIVHIKDALLHLQTLQQAINQETTSLDELITKQASKKQEFDLNFSERQRILEQLANTLESQDKELKRLQEDKHQLQALLGTLEETFKDVPQPPGQQTFAKLQGQLPYPVSGKLIKRFGEQLVNTLKWQGVLITANAGEKVQAIADGRVAFAQWFRNLGLLVIIDHGKGYMSLYAHNQSLYAKTGDWVKAGDIIASVGNSGGHDKPALYFEIRRQGVPVNPLLWLQN
ncbi:MAG: hypothetical protein BWK79_05875 [Beggiatoa sp. IS2]|nr:MAG: hypothetical protein BWK79_05875 [Beggiatoa sp. IS2]